MSATPPEPFGASDDLHADRMATALENIARGVGRLATCAEIMTEQRQADADGTRAIVAELRDLLARLPDAAG